MTKEIILLENETKEYLLEGYFKNILSNIKKYTVDKIFNLIRKVKKVTFGSFKNTIENAKDEKIKTAYYKSVESSKLMANEIKKLSKKKDKITKEQIKNNVLSVLDSDMRAFLISFGIIFLALIILVYIILPTFTSFFSILSTILFFLLFPLMLSNIYKIGNILITEYKRTRSYKETLRKFKEYLITAQESNPKHLEIFLFFKLLLTMTAVLCGLCYFILGGFDNVFVVFINKFFTVVISFFGVMSFFLNEILLNKISTLQKNELKLNKKDKVKVV